MTSYAAHHISLSVRSRDHVLVRNFGKAISEAGRQLAADGNPLKPYGVFPIVDNHGAVAWTVLVERGDGVPLGQHDVDLVRQICAGATNAMEQVLHSRIYRDWMAQIIAITQGHTSGKKLLPCFADFIVKARLAARGRVFRITEDDRQIGVYQTEKRPAPGFLGKELNANCHQFLEKMRRTEKLLLVRRRNRSYPVDGTDDFELMPVSKVEHAQWLRKRNTSEWIEAPIFHDGEMVFKVVFDHMGHKDDRFTLSELHLLATLCKATSLANEAVSNQALRSRLCRAGSVAALLHHRLCGCVDSLLEPDQDGQERQFRKDLRGARASLNRLQKLFGPRSVQQRTTIGQEIKEAADLIAPWLGNITLKTPTDFPDIPFKESNYALSLILLVLFENSIAARWAAALSKQCASIFP